MTSTFVPEGDGRVAEYVGGYEDYLRQRAVSPAPSEAARPSDTPARPLAGAGPRRLSYNGQRELASLPSRIDALEAEQRALYARIEAPEFYKEPRDTIADAVARAEAFERDLAAAYERWLALEARQ